MNLLNKSLFKHRNKNGLIAYLAILALLASNFTFGNSSVAYAANAPEFCGFTQVTAGYTTFALDKEGNVWAWGQNREGELANGLAPDFSAHPTPIQIQGISNVTAIASKGYHILALKSDGTVWSWGNNSAGQLGYSTGVNNYSNTPTQISSLGNNVSKIYAGLTDSFAVLNDNTVWAWGQNNFGQLGNGNTTNQTTPVQILSTLDNHIGPMAVGNYHTMIMLNGFVYAWGRNDAGQLAQAPSAYNVTPTLISGLSPYNIAAGGSHSLAVMGDGTVKSWGSNSWGQLGYSTGVNNYSSTPTTISGLSSVNSVDGGTSYSVALKGDGTAWAWGLNSEGQLGTNGSPTTPAQITVLGSNFITQIAASDMNTAAVYNDMTNWNDGNVQGWGYSVYGATGYHALACLTPTSGSTWGNENVNISGINFASGATVSFGGTPAVSTTFNSSTSLTAVSPLHTAGTVNLTVTNPDFQSTTFYRKYTYVNGPTPSITNVNPSSGLPAGGVALTLTGTNFMNGATVTFGGNPLNSTVVNNTTITTDPIPAGNGWTQIVVTNPDGQQGYSSYTYNAAPTVTSVNQPWETHSGAVAGGTTVNVYGTGFIDGATVTFGGAAATNVTFIDSGTLSVTTPAHAAGDVDVTVTNPDLQSGTLTNGFTYIVMPVITQITPNSGTYLGGNSITIIGSDFDAGPNVYVDNNPVTITSHDANHIVGTIPTFTPPHLSGPVNVTVQNSDSQTTTSFGGYTFNYQPQFNSTNGFTKIASGFLDSLAIKSDGTVWAWGSSDSGQLGFSGGFSVLPFRISNLANVTDVAAGRYHSLIINNGNIWSMGYNGQGQLGNGNNTSSNDLVEVVNGEMAPLSGATSVAAGQYHSLAVVNGSVWAWGQNNVGQLGDSGTTPSNTAKLVPGLSGIIKVAAGNDFSLALMNDGTVWAWGNNSKGQLGQGSTSPYINHPVQVSGLSNISDITAGQSFAMAMDNAGHVYTWGTSYNSSWGYDSGVLGYSVSGPSYVQSTATQVPGLSNVTAISAGRFHAEALSAGTVYVWGSNDNGQLGDGNTDTNTHTAPTAIPGLLGMTGVASGRYNSFALKNGKIFSWGANWDGQLGNADPTSTDNYDPTTTEVVENYSPDPALNIDTGAAAGGDTVVMSGFNFKPGAVVTFGSTPAPSVAVLGSSPNAYNGTTAIVTTPAHANGTVNVTITNPDGQNDTLINAFTFTGGAAASAPAFATPSLNAGDGQITVTWNLPEDGGSPITSYTIRYGLNSSGCNPSSELNTGCTEVVISSTDPEFTSRTKILTGLTNGSVYNVGIVTTNAIGSTYSPSVSATPTAGGSNPSSIGTNATEFISCNTTIGGSQSFEVRTPSYPDANTVAFQTRTTDFYNTSNASLDSNEFVQLYVSDDRGYDPSAMDCGSGYSYTIQSNGLYLNGNTTSQRLALRLGRAVGIEKFAWDTVFGPNSPINVSEVFNADVTAPSNDLSTAVQVTHTNEAFLGRVIMTLDGSDLEVIKPAASIPAGNYSGTITFTQI